MENLILLSIALTGILFMSAYKKNDDISDAIATTDQTISEHALYDESFSIFAKAFLKVDIGDVLNGRVVHVIDKVLLPAAI